MTYFLIDWMQRSGSNSDKAVFYYTITCIQLVYAKSVKIQCLYYKKHTAAISGKKNECVCYSVCVMVEIVWFLSSDIYQYFSCCFGSIWYRHEFITNYYIAHFTDIHYTEWGMITCGSLDQWYQQGFILHSFSEASFLCTQYCFFLAE